MLIPLLLMAFGFTFYFVSLTLIRMRSEILARRNELGNLLAREEGKTLPEATGEVMRAGNIFKFFAGEALRVGGETIPSVRPGVGAIFFGAAVVLTMLAAMSFDPRLIWDRAGHPR